MDSNLPSRVVGLRSFLTYLAHLVHYCYVLRGLLGMHVAFVILGGVAFAAREGIPIGQGLYFALITSTTVGFGDITPKTLLGRTISVSLALVGTIFFGLLVAMATQAVTVTIQEYRDSKDASKSDEGNG